jgi:hypothetical protein
MTDLDLRRAIIAEYARLAEAAYDQAWPDAERAINSDPQGQAYQQFLVDVRVARCPFCDDIATMSWDPIGLDGAWWCHWFEWRGPRKPICEHFLGLAGAVTLGDEIPHTVFPVTPGPDVPYVIPTVLCGLNSDEILLYERDSWPELRAAAPSRPAQVRAVLSRLDVGGLPAYAVHYYSKPLLETQPAFSTWGSTDHGLNFYAVDHDREVAVFEETDLDFDLRPWIEAEMLYWIAPGDETLTLRWSAEDCPYLDLPGSRSLRYISEGELVEYD